MLDIRTVAFSGPVCAWSVASRKFAVYCSPDVIERLCRECSRSEIGGMLLGRTETREDTTIFWVEGFQAVDSCLLSEADLRQLHHPLEMSRSGCIGIYRSQAGARRLALDGLDVKLPQRFQAGDALFLLLAPALNRAAFFSRTNGDLEYVGEFALPAAGTLLPGLNGRLRYPHPRIAPPERGLRESQFQSPGTVSAAVAEVKWRVWALAALIAVLFSLAGARGLLYFFAMRAERARSAATLVDLKIQSVGSALRLLWDPDSAALLGAARVVLHVRDGGYQSDRDLAVSELRSGNALYQPRSEDVLFQLDAYSGAPAASGSVRVINGRQAQSRALKAPSLNSSATNGRAASTTATAPAPPQVNRMQPAPKNGDVSEPWLGMSLRPVTRDVAMASHLPQTYGFLVTRVDASSPAGSSGVESGDILVAMNGQRIADTAEWKLKIRELAYVPTLTLAVIRDGEIHQIEVDIGGRASSVLGAAPLIPR